MSETLQKITVIWRHIEEVQKNCFLLGEKLIAAGEEDLARQLISNSLVHDQSKFLGIEWEYLQVDDEDGELYEKKRMAIRHHNSCYPHHPEYWKGIKNMPSVYAAEMCCDWKARSSEFGSSLKEWIDGDAAIRYGFTKRDKIYREIMKYTNLLLEKPFTQP